MNNKIRDNAQCRNCNAEESLEHLFYDCNETKIFWTDFHHFFQQKTQQNIELTCKEVIFGVLPYKRNELLNHLLLIANITYFQFAFSTRSHHFPFSLKMLDAL